jgi:hypothetical protein
MLANKSHHLFQNDEYNEAIANEARSVKEIQILLSYIYPFVIEFALTGSGVFLVMFLNIGVISANEDPEPVCETHPPQKSYKTRCIEILKEHIYFTHSLKGFLCGLCVLISAIASVFVYFYAGERNPGVCNGEYHSELLVNVSATILNLFGIIACIFGVVRLQKLHHEPRFRNLHTPTSSFDLDVVILYFGAFFSIIYSWLVLLTGSLGHNEELGCDHANIQIVMGIMEIIQVLIQILYLKEFRQKLLPQGLKGKMPGRQIAMYIFLLNFSQWIILTFERQTLDASIHEIKFYGIAWIIIERITIPFTIFFRFHSAMITLELWEEVYKMNNNVTSSLTNLMCN